MIITGLAAFWSLHDHVCYHGTLQSERKISGIAKDGHLEELETMDEGNAVLPLGETVVIPHFPEEPTNKGSQGRTEDLAPITMRYR